MQIFRNVLFPPLTHALKSTYMYSLVVEDNMKPNTWETRYNSGEGGARCSLQEVIWFCYIYIANVIGIVFVLSLSLSLSLFSGLLMSITLPCYDQNKKFIGVAGTDINIEDLTSDLSLFDQGRSTYTFMTSRRAIVHPLLPAPTSAYGDPVYLDIRALEPEPEFNEVFASMTV